jgi:hypothetical protein
VADSGPVVRMRVVVPVAIALVVAIGGGLVAWDIARTIGVAQDLAAAGVTTTAYDASSGAGRGNNPVTATVDLPDGARRVELEGAFGGASLEEGAYAGTFEVLHDPDGGAPVMAVSDVERTVEDEYLPRIALVAGVLSVVALLGLVIAAVVAFRPRPDPVPRPDTRSRAERRRSGQRGRG